MHCKVLNTGVQQTLNEELIYLFLRSPDINKAWRAVFIELVGFHCIQLKSSNSIEIPSPTIMKTRNKELSIATNTRYSPAIIPL